MLIDIIRLPVRYTEFDDYLSTIVPFWSSPQDDTWVDQLGRIIPLILFSEERIKIYKSIENDGYNSIERIFLSEADIDIDNVMAMKCETIYPIQKKIFNRKDPLVGTTIKYVNGISNFIQDMCNCDHKTYPTIYSQLQYKCNLVKNSPYQYIIPANDSSLLSSTDWINTTPNKACFDNCINNDVKLGDILGDIDPNFRMHTPSLTMDMITPPFESDDLGNTDPINNDWEKYNLLMQLNDLAVSDITIEADITSPDINISFGSRYVGLFDYKQTQNYNEVCNCIKPFVRKIISHKFKYEGWRKVIINKLWTEEVFITAYVYCPGRSSAIEVHYYVDLPVLILGTVALN